MTPVSLRSLAIIGALSCGIGALGASILLGSGRGPVLVTPLLALVFIVIAVGLLIAGLAVRRMRDHKQTWMTPIMAMRTALFARACALVGSGAAGLLAGVVVSAVSRTHVSAMLSSAVGAGAGALAGVVLVVIAVIVERWCVIDSDDDDARQGSAAGSVA